MSTDTRGIILDTARRLFKNYVDPALLTEVSKGIWPNELWSILEKNGFTLLDEDGLTYEYGLALLQTAGYYAVPAPLAESILASKILIDLGYKMHQGVLTLGIKPVGHVVVTEKEGKLVLTGKWSEVPWGRRADFLVLWVPCIDGHNRIAVVRNEDIRIENHTSLASEPLDTVYLDHVTPVFSSKVRENRSTLLAQAALTRIMSSVGALERILDMTVQYSGERSQFGRPIGKFQAVQQQIAEIAAEIAAFRAIANKALKKVGELYNEGLTRLVHNTDGKEATKTVCSSNSDTTKKDLTYVVDKVIATIALAKIRLAKTAQISTTHAHQVHGAMGITQEYTLHYYTRRVWSYRHEYGNEREWAGVFATVMKDSDLWEFITE